MYFYSLYTPTGFLWCCSKWKLQYVGGKETHDMSPEALRSQYKPQYIFHTTTNTVFILQTNDYRARTFVIPDSCFSFLSFPRVVFPSYQSTSNLSKHHRRVNSVYQLKDQVNDFRLSEACGCINPQGTGLRHRLIQRLGGLSTLEKKYINK